jgi:hypothetical protein
VTWSLHCSTRPPQPQTVFRIGIPTREFDDFWHRV